LRIEDAMLKVRVVLELTAAHFFGGYC